MFLVILLFLAVHGGFANEGLIKTINYQGFLINETSQAPENGTFTIEVSMHEPGIRPPFTPPPTGNALWQEYHEKVTVRDGIFNLRLGMLNPLRKELFDGTRELQLTFGIVPYGTNGAYSWLGPMQIDGNAYSVSSISVRGSDTKTGTLTIQSRPGLSDGFESMLELRTPDELLSEGLDPEYRYSMRVQHLSEPGSIRGTGLNIRFPRSQQGQAPMLQSQNMGANLPYSTQRMFDPISPLQPGNTGLYVRQGTVDLHTIEVHPLILNGIPQLPGNFEADAVAVDGRVEVGRVDVLGNDAGIVEGSSLKHCFRNTQNPIDLDDCEPFSGEPFSNNRLDPYPSENETSRYSTLRKLTIAPNGNEPGELTVRSLQLQSNSTGSVQMSSGALIAPVLHSTYLETDRERSPYRIAPGGLTVLDSAILKSDPTGSSRASGGVNVENSLMSPMTAYTIFDLVSLAPVCQKNGQYHMALREDYCSSPTPNDKYRHIDPCRTENGAALPIQGIPSSCYSGFGAWTHPNEGYLTESHVHEADAASAAMIIDLINQASAGKRLIRRILPTEAVNRLGPVTLTQDNIFEQSIQVRSPIEGTINNTYKARIEGDIQNVYVRSYGPSAAPTPTLAFENPNFNANVSGAPPRPMNVHFGRSTLAEVTAENNVQVLKDNDQDGIKPLVVRQSVEIQNPPGPDIYTYLPSDLRAQTLTFDSGAAYSEKVLSNLGEVSVMEGLGGASQGRFVDQNNPSYYLHFSSTSRLNQLKATGSAQVSLAVTVSGNTTLQETVRTQEIGVEQDLQAGRFSDLDDPRFFVNPAAQSHIQGLRLDGTLLARGGMQIRDDLEIGGALVVNGNFSTSGSVGLSGTGATLRAQALHEINNGAYRIDPSAQSRLDSIAIQAGGSLQIEGDMTLAQTLDHAGDAYLNSNLRIRDEVLSPWLRDSEDPYYRLEPHQQTRLLDLDALTSLSSSGISSFAEDLQSQGSFDGDSSLQVYGPSHVGHFVYQNAIGIQQGTTQPFFVDDTGHLLAQSLTLSDDLFLGSLDIAGSLRVQGGSANLNIPTSMQRMRVVTHSLQAWRSTSPPPSPFANAAASGFATANPSLVTTAFTLDRFGHLELYQSATLDDYVEFSTDLRLGRDGNDLLLSDQQSQRTTIYVGPNGQKDLRLAGTSARTMHGITLSLSQWTDRDDHSYGIHPAHDSILQTLQLTGSLNATEGITAPYSIDLENSFILDPDGHSQFKSVDIYNSSTLEQLNALSYQLDSAALSPSQTLLDLQHLQVYKSDRITRTGTDTYFNSVVHSNQNTGIRIRDTSAGSGILVTPGDLSDLIDGGYADRLHSHNRIGGVPIHEFARLDVANTVEAAQINSSNEELKALHGSHVLSATSTVLSIEPADSTTLPLIAVLLPDESVVFSVSESGLAQATEFRGSGALLFDVQGSAGEHDAILNGTIANSRIQDGSLSGSNLASGILSSRHFAFNSLSQQKLAARTLQGSILASKAVSHAHVAAEAISGEKIATQTLDSRTILNASLSGWNLDQATLSADQIVLATLPTRVFSYQAAATQHISSGAILQMHVSTGAVNSARVRPDSILDASMAPLILQTYQIQNDAVDDSKIMTFTILNEDFAPNVIASAKIRNGSILNSVIRTNELTSGLVLADSVNFQRIATETVQTVDIATSTFTHNPDPTQHKIAHRAIQSRHILDNSLRSSNFATAALVLSKIGSNVASSAQIQTGSIQSIDIATQTLMGEKIADLSLVTTQFQDASVLNAKIADQIFASSQIATDTLDFLAINSSAITSAKISDNTISTTHVTDGSLLDRDFNDESVEADKWVSYSVATSRLMTAAVTLLKFEDDSIDSSKIESLSIVNDSLDKSSIASINIAARQIPSDRFAPLSILNADLADGVITERILAPASLQTTHILDLSILSSHIPADLLTSATLATDSITSNKIQNSQITNSKVQDFSLLSSNFALIAVTTEHLDQNSVTDRTLAGLQLEGRHLIPGEIIHRHIADSQIDSRVVEDFTLNSLDVLEKTLVSSAFMSDVLTEGHFQSNAISSAKIATDSLVETQFQTRILSRRNLQTTTLSSQSLASSAIGSQEIRPASLDATRIQSQSLGDEHLASGTLTTRVFAPLAVGTENIINQSLLQEDLEQNSIESRHIASNTLTRDRFSAGSIRTTHIADFTLTSNEFQSATFESSQISMADSLASGFQSLFPDEALTDALAVHQLGSGAILLSDAKGVYLAKTLSAPPKLVFESPEPVYEIKSRASKVLLSAGTGLYMSTDGGQSFFFLKNFDQTIEDFEFADNRRVILNAGTTYLSHDGGFGWKAVTGLTQAGEVNWLPEDDIIWHMGHTASRLQISVDNGESFTTTGPLSLDTEKAYEVAFRGTGASFLGIVAYRGTAGMNKAVRFIQSPSTTYASGGEYVSDLLESVADAREPAFSFGSGTDPYHYYLSLSGNIFSYNTSDLSKAATTNHNVYPVASNSPQYRHFVMVARDTETDTYSYLAKSTNFGTDFKAYPLSDSTVNAKLSLKNNDTQLLHHQNLIYLQEGGTYRSLGMDHSVMRGAIEAVAAAGNRIWMVRDSKLYRTDDDGLNWTEYGDPGVDSLLAASTDNVFGYTPGNATVSYTSDGLPGSFMGTSVLGQPVRTAAILDSTTALFGIDGGTAVAVNETGGIQTTQVSTTAEIRALNADQNGGFLALMETGELHYYTSIAGPATDLSATAPIDTGAAHVCAASTETFVVVGDSSNTWISHDTGQSWQTLLPESLQGDSYAACLARDDGSVYIAPTNSKRLVWRELQGITGDRLAQRTLNNTHLEHGFTSAQVRRGSLLGEDLQDGSIQGDTITSGSIQTLQLADSAVSGAKIAGETLTTRLIANHAISHPRVANDIDGEKIGDNVLLGEDFASLGVDYELIKQQSMTPELLTTSPTDGLVHADFAAGAITSGKIVDRSLGGSRIATGALNATHMAAGSVRSVHIQSRTLQTEDVSPSSLPFSRLLPGSVTAAQFSTSVISANRFADDAYWNDVLMTDALAAGTFLTGSITSDEIQGRVFEGGLIENDSIRWSSILSSSLEERHFATGVVQGPDFLAKTITMDQIEDGAVGSETIATGSIEDFHFATGVITASKVDTPSVSGIHVKLSTMPASTLIHDTYTGSKIAPTTLSESKVATRALTSGNFSDLQESNVATGGLSRQQARLLYANGSEFRVRRPNQTERSIVSLASLGGGDPRQVRISPAGNKAVFLHSETSRLWWVDLFDGLSLDTGVSLHSSPEPTAPLLMFDTSANSLKVAYKPNDSNTVRTHHLIDGDQGTLFTMSSSTNAKTILSVDNATDAYWIDNSGDLQNHPQCIGADFTGLEPLLGMTADESSLAVFNGSELILCDTASGGTQTLTVNVNQFLFHPQDTDFIYFRNANRIQRVLSTGDNRIENLMDVSDILGHSATFALYSGHSLEDNTLNDSLLANGALNGSHLASQSVTSGVFSGAPVGPEHLADNSVTGRSVQTRTLVSNRIQATELSANKLSPQALEGRHFQTDTMTSVTIEDGAIVNDSIANSQILTRHLKLSSITPAKVEAQTFTNRTIRDSSVSLASKLAADAVTSGAIASSSLTNGHIQNAQIRPYHLQSDTLSASRLQGTAIENRHLQTEVLGSEHIGTILEQSYLASGALGVRDGWLVFLQNGDIWRANLQANSESEVFSDGALTQIRATRHANFLLASNPTETRLLKSEDLTIVRTFATSLVHDYDSRNNRFLALESGTIKGFEDDLSELKRSWNSATTEADWSPSGESIVYANGTDVYESDEGGDTMLQTAPENVVEVRYGLDQRIFYATADAVYESDGREIFNPADDVLSLSPSLNSTAIYVLTQNGDSDIHRVHADLNAPQTNTLLKSFGSAVTDLELMPYSAPVSDSIDSLASSSVTSEHIAARTFEGNQLQNSALITSKVQSKTLTGDILAAGSLTNAKASGTFSTAKLTDGVILSEHIVDGSLTNAKLALDAVSGAKVQDTALQASHFGGALSPDRLMDTALEGNRFLADTIDSSKIQNGAVQAAMVIADELSSDRVTDDIITSALIVDSSLDSTVFMSSAITSSHVPASTIQASAIAVGSLTDTNLAPGSIRNAKVSVGGIDSSDYLKDEGFGGNIFQASTISSAQILSASGVNFQANSIDENRIDSLTGASLSMNSINSDKLLANDFGQSVLSTGAVSGWHINPASLSPDRLSDGAIQTANLENSGVDGGLITGTILANQIEDGSLNENSFDQAIPTGGLGSLTLVASQFTENPGERLTAAELANGSVNARVIGASGVQEAELVSAPIVTSTAPGLLAAADLVLDRHIGSNVLEGRILGHNTLSAADIAAGIPETRIQLDTMTTAQLKPLFNADFDPGVFDAPRLADSFIPGSKLVGTIPVASITEISGMEFVESTFSNADIANDSLKSGDLKAGEILDAQVINLQWSDIDDDSFTSTKLQDGILTAVKVQPDVLTMAEFSTPIDAAAKFDDLEFDDLATSDGAELERLTGRLGNANSLHQHEMLEQERVCDDSKTGPGLPLANSPVGTSGSSFCITETLSDTWENHRDKAADITYDGVTVTGKICSMQQLVRARYANVTVPSLGQDVHSSDYILKQDGFVYSLQVLSPFNLADDGTGTVNTQPAPADSDTVDARYCF